MRSVVAKFLIRLTISWLRFVSLFYPINSAAHDDIDSAVTDLSWAENSFFAQKPQGK